MKRLATLFMLLIGMISYTSMASTPLMEQKQKPTYEQSVMQTQDVVKVELEFAVFSYDAVFFVNENLQSNSVNRYEPVKLYHAAIMNQSWSVNTMRFKTIPYTEVLHSNYIIDKEKAIQVIGLDNARSNC